MPDSRLKSRLLVLAAALIVLAPTAAWASSAWDQQCRTQFNKSDAGRTSGSNICWWQSGSWSGGNCTITTKCFVGTQYSLSTVTVGLIEAQNLQNCTGYIALSC